MLIKANSVYEERISASARGNMQVRSWLKIGKHLKHSTSSDSLALNMVSIFSKKKKTVQRCTSTLNGRGDCMEMIRI